MNNTIRTIVKLNFKTIDGAYIAAGAGVAMFLVQYIIDTILVMKGENFADNTGLSFSWALWALPVAAGIIIPAANFRRIISLGGKREPFFRACIINYAILAAAASLLGVIVLYAVDYSVISAGLYGGLLSVSDTFGWGAQGPAVLFLRQFAFLFLTAVFTHTFVAAQGKWYGWAATIMLIVILSVFLPIEPLRNIVVTYFYLILFNPNALAQIGLCLAIGVAIYLLNRPIFARKAI